MTAARKQPTALFNAAACRQDFPLFQNHPELTFLDSAASAQKPACVMAAINDCYSRYYANIHRGVYSLSMQATQAFEDARATCASFIGAAKAEEIVFVRGATEGINLVAHSWARHNLKAGDAVVLSEMEHHANIVPWQLLRDEIGIELQIIPITDAGNFDVAAFEATAKPNAKLLAITQMSNALGTMPPVKALLDAAKARGMTTLVDGCQAIVHEPVDVQALGCDFYVFSGHKLYGPTGIGVLYGRAELLATMPPYQGGGEMIHTVSFAKTTFAPPPARFEAGTPHIAGAIGLKAAIDYITALGLGNIAAHEAALLELATSKFSALPGLRIIGTDSHKGAIVSFVAEDIHPHDMGTVLDQHGVCVRAGHHCAQPVMQRFNIPATTRASLAMYNTVEEIDRLAAAIKEIYDLFR